MGYEISTAWYEGLDISKIVLVLPGYSSSKERQKGHAEAMVQETGASALVVDFSGHGTSPFELRDTRPGQHFLELICVFDWLKEKYPNAKITVSGNSYGGFLAIQLTKYREFDNLILRAPAIYKPSAFYDLWARRIDNVEEYDKEMASYRRDTELLAKHPLFNRAANFKGGVLVVVHGEDELIPRETTDTIIASFHADSFIAEGFQHGIDKSNIDEAQLAEYQDKISSWLNEH